MQQRLSDTIDEETLDHLGKVTGFFKRLRKIPPSQLIPALLTTLSGKKTDTLSDLWREFHDFSGETVNYTSFRDQLSKDAFPQLMRRLYLHAAERLILRVLTFPPDSPFSRLKSVLIQDGSSFALHDLLATAFPGRFNKTSPAAVELHATLDLLTGTPHSVTLTPDTHSERAYLPAPDTLEGVLLLMDRGYFGFAYLAELEAAGGRFVARAPKNVNSYVMGIYRNGELCDLETPQSLKTVVKAHPGEDLDLVIQIQVEGKAYHFRMVVINTPKGKTYLLTNLPAAHFPAHLVGLAYRLRWQVELLFKEWKSHANLHRFPTAHAAIAEGLIWGSLLVALLNRFVSHAAQLVGKVAISTLKAAKILNRRMPDLMGALFSEWRFEAEFRRAVEALIRDARRSNPKRDKQSGRGQTGLSPVFQP